MSLRRKIALWICPELDRKADVVRVSIDLAATECVIRLADRYCAHVGRSDMTLARRIGLHNRFFLRIRNGEGCSVANLHKAHVWLSDNWPADLAWPADIPRPSPSPERN